MKIIIKKRVQGSVLGQQPTAFLHQRGKGKLMRRQSFVGGVTAEVLIVNGDLYELRAQCVSRRACGRVKNKMYSEKQNV